jgi:hypothetical protein
MGRAPTRRHVPYSTEPCLPAKVCSGAAMCLVGPDAALLIGRYPVPPRVSCLRTPPPCKGGLRCTTCPTDLDHASLQGRAPVCHVSCSSGYCLPVGEGSDLPRVLRLRILPSYREGSGAATACPVVPCGLRGSNIKKSLACLPVRLGPRVPNAQTHVFKTPDVRAIMRLQDVWAGSAVHACKACGHAAILRLQCSTVPGDHLPVTVTVQGDPTARCNVAD